MQLIQTKFVGKTKYTFQFEGSNLHECLMESKKIAFHNIPECGLCHSDKLYLTAYTTKEDGYTYVKAVCQGCGASLTFGRPKTEPDTYYPRKKEDRSFDWKPKEAGASQPSTQEVQPEEDDLPF